MRRIYILLILFSISFTLKSFGVLGDSHSSVLLAIGLVILAAYTLSELGSALKLPQVTGYILTGLLLGPYALKILSSQVVEEIEMFNTLAIGLIAITAGLELHFSSLKKVIAPILTTSFLKIILLGFTSTLAIFIANRYVYDFGLGNGMVLFSLALVFAALALGTSPAISVAVISEMKAKSRMSQMVLGSAIVKDVLVVVTLAIMLSFAKSVASGGGDMLSSFLHLSEELFYSLFAGGVLGAIFIGYIKYIRKEMFLFIAAMILGTAEISHAIHLELLLVFIVAGIVVRNFSQDQHILHEALEKVSLPVFVVFFTNVGAGLDLTSTWEFLPVAALLFGTRALSFIASSWFAGGWHGESTTIRKKIWLGYLPQAGVTLGLIQIAARDLSQHSELITNIGIGMVTLNLLVGPIFLRMVLKAEEPNREESNDPKESDREVKNMGVDEVLPDIDFDEDFSRMLRSHCDKIEDRELEKSFSELVQQYYDVFRKNQILPQKNILNNFVEELKKMQGLSEQDIVAKIDDHFRKMGEKGTEIYNAMSLLQKEIDHLLVILKSPVPASAIERRKGDSLGIQLKKLLYRPYFWFHRDAIRSVPVRKLAKYHLEPFIGTFSLELINSWFRLLGKHIEIFQISLENHNFESGDIVSRISKENDIWVRSVQSDFCHEFSRVARPWVKHLNQINTTYLPDSRIRYSQVEPQITEKFDKAKKDSITWQEKFIYCRNRLKIIVQSALLSSSVEKLLDEKFFNPVEQAKQNADQLVQDVFSFFSKIEGPLKKTESPGHEVYEKLYHETKTFSQEQLQADIKTKYVRGSFRLLNRDISMNLRKSLPREEGYYQIASEQTPAHDVKDPAEILVKKINLHELFEQSILINFLPVIEEKIEGVSNYLESLLLEMEQAFSIINYSLESQKAGESELNSQELSESLLNAISSEKEKIEELYLGLTEYIKDASQSAEKLLEECQEEVRQGIERFSVVTTAKNQFRQKLYNFVQKAKAGKHKVDENLEKTYNRIKNFGLQQTERDIDRAIHKKMAAKTLDTTTVREFVNQTFTLNREIKNLPRVYFRLFSLDPIQDKRFFLAHSERWQHFAPFAKSDRFKESQKILVIGDRGIGKSSLINVVQMDIQGGSLIRIVGEEQNSPLATIARQLGCKNNNASILSKLREKPTTIIIDDVDHMLNRRNLSQFERLFEVIKQSPHQSHWILSITQFNLEALDRAYKIRSLFNKLVDLHEINLETSREIILGRHRLSGLQIQYPKSMASDMALKFGLSTEDEMFFRILYERSHGHLRHLIYLWLQSLSQSDGKSVQLSLNKTIDRGLPMIHEFSSIQKYILSELYCFHNLSTQVLSQNLGLSLSIIENETQYLEYCGLLKSKGVDRQIFEIPHHLVMPVGVELKKGGILHEEFSRFRS